MLEPGLDYFFYATDKYTIRLIFENDSENDLIFQLSYKGKVVDMLGALGGISTFGIATAFALAAVLSF